MASKQLLYILIVVLLICLGAIYFTWEMTKKVKIEIPTISPRWIEAKEAADTLNLEITPYEEPVSIYKEWKHFRDYLDKQLGEKMGLKVNLKVARDYRSAINNVGLGVADIAVLPASAYIEARKDYCVHPLMVPIWNQESQGNRCLLVARTDSDINSIADIKGKSFAYGDEKSLCGSLIPHKWMKENNNEIQMLIFTCRKEAFENYREGINWMKENNIVYQGDLKAVKYFPNYDAVLQAITSGEYDVGGVKESVFKKANLPNLKIVATSEPISDFVLVSTFDLERPLIDQIIQILSEIDLEIVKKINPGYIGWGKISDESFDSLRGLVKEIHGLDYALPTADFCMI